MLDELIAIHREVMATTSTQVKRYLHDLINWKAQSICIFGDRGVGKTTLLCQHLLEKYQSVEKALYISADNINVTAAGLLPIAKKYFNQEGEALFIDEVHKYPNWSIEVKNIIDTYKSRAVVFSANSSLDLTRSKADLSRRVVYYPLAGLSFREFLHMKYHINIQVLTLEEILKNHVAIAEKIQTDHILKYFKEYLTHGYYPFFLEGIEDYLSKLNNVIEKVIYEDIAVVFNLKQTTLPILKKILWLIATSDSFTPNIEKMSNNLGISREIVYNCLEHLEQSGLLNNLYPMGKGLKGIRKPGKIYLNNTNLLAAINGTLKRNTSAGSARESFFVNQTKMNHQIHLHGQGDFILDKKHVIEVGGKGKDYHQISNIKDSYLILDDIEIGYKNKIPLFLFGFLY